MQSILLFIVIVALQAADGFLTWRILQGGGRELNPVMRFFIDRLGLVPGLAAPKLVLVVLVFLYLLQFPALLWIIALVYVWVVLQNWEQLEKQRAKGGTA